VDDFQEFDAQNRDDIAAMGKDADLQRLSQAWFERATTHRYSYHFRWMGLPIIQFPQDIVAMQELLWDVKPELVIETGVARGGSVVFYASILELIGGNGRVIGIDVDIRPHNRAAIEAHATAPRIDLIQGSSLDPAIVAEVGGRAQGRRPVLVALDSNHTHEHVLRELELYSTFVTAGSYLVVFDTCIEWTPPQLLGDRAWGRGDNPWTAVQTFLRGTDRFVVDGDLASKLQVTVCRGGFLKCLK
jgi:cephalosporin hydroxylase